MKKQLLVPFFSLFAALCGSNQGQAAISLSNGSFEDIGASYLGALGGLHEASGWTNLTGNPGVLFQASSAVASNPPNPEFTSIASSATGTRYLRLAADPGGPAIWGATAQLVGTMTAGETYTLLADLYAGPGDGGQLYGARISFVNEVSAAPSTTYATQTVDGVANTEFLPNAFSLSYTAGPGDTGLPLVVLLQALDNGSNVQSRRGGLDNVRLATVPEPGTALLAGTAALGFLRRRRR